MCIFSKDLFFSIFSTKPAYLLARVTIVPDPSDAVVTLTAPGGYSQEGNYIEVPIGTIVSYKVEKQGLKPSGKEVLVVGNTTIPVKLFEPIERTVTIETTPSDASVIFVGDGIIEQGGKSAKAAFGSMLSYTVSDPKGELSLTETGSLTVQTDEVISVTMRTKVHVTNVTPPDAVVKINGELGSYRELPCNQVMNVSVTRDGYNPFSPTFEKNSRGIVPDFVSEVELQETTYTLTVASTPTNASLSVVVGTETHTDIGRIVVDNVLPGTTITATATLSGYDTVTETFTMPASNFGKTLSLNETLYPVTITATPSEAAVIIKVNGSQVASGTGVATTSVKKGTSITYEASYEGAEETAGPVTINSAYSASLVLDAAETTEGEVTLLTETTTKNLGVGKYSYIIIGAGGNGGGDANTTVSGSFSGQAGPSGGGGGSAYVEKGTFTITSRQDVTFSVASSSSGSTEVSGSTAGVLASVSNGSNGQSSGHGGNGSSGGGAGGIGAVGTSVVPKAGGSGGKGGYNGTRVYTSHNVGVGVKNATSLNANNAGTAAASGGTTTAWGTAGGGGAGCSSLQDTLLTKSGFDSATADSLYAVMSAGGGGGGNYVPSRKTASPKNVNGEPGGGGGGWFNGTAGSGHGVNVQVGKGGAGAILYRRIAWS